jgi:hypothetical protein
MQRKLITALINEHNGNREVGHTLAVRPNQVIYKNLPTFLTEEDVIHEVIVDQGSHHNYQYLTCRLLDGPFEQEIDSNTLEEGPPTPKDLL